MKTDPVREALIDDIASICVYTCMGAPSDGWRTLVASALAAQPAEPVTQAERDDMAETLAHQHDEPGAFAVPFLTIVQGDDGWADEFMAWYKPAQWLGEERACAAFLAGKVAELAADAQRYRRLGWLVEFDDWGVVRGHDDDSWMSDKSDMDAQLDSPEVVAEAEASERALTAARGKEPTA